MNISRYVIFFIVFIGLSAAYKNLKLDDDKNTSQYYYNMVNKYLLNNNPLGRSNKPYIWIHLHSDDTIIPEVNSRYWLSFHSRDTKELNQPYQYLTIQSIINKCGDDFNIALIDDNSFEKILPNWSLDLSKIANPSRTHVRLLGLTQILNIYGGMVVPSSFVCFKSLKELYNTNINNGKMFVGEFLNKTAAESLPNLVAPSSLLMGCPANNDIMNEFINYLEILNSTDLTAESDFLGNTNQWLNNAVTNQKINLIKGEYIGTKKTCGTPIYIEELIDSTFVELNCNAFGLYIPWNDIINRINLQWFARLSPEQVLESDTVIGKYLLVNTQEEI
jgi:hypothetical protein